MKLPILLLGASLLGIQTAANAAPGNGDNSQYERNHGGGDRGGRNDNNDNRGPGRNPGHGGGHNPNPAPTPRPNPAPAPRPNPAPAPRPNPAPAPRPNPAPAPRPNPVPAPRPNPRPHPVPAPRPNPAPAPRPNPRPIPRPPIDRIHETDTTVYGISRRTGGEWIRIQLSNPVEVENFSLRIRRAGLRVHEAYAYTTRGRFNLYNLVSYSTEYGYIYSGNMRSYGVVLSIDLRLESMGGNADVDAILQSYDYTSLFPVRF